MIDESLLDEELKRLGLDESLLDRELEKISRESSAREMGKGKLTSAIAGGIQGATLDFGDEIGGGLIAAGKKISGNNEPLSELYKQERDSLRAIADSAAKENPKLFYGSQIAGGLATSLIPGGALASAAKIGKTGQVLGLGALAGAGASKTNPFDDTAKFSTDVATSAALAGALDKFGLPLAKAGARKAWDKLESTASKAGAWAKDKAIDSVSAISGVGREAIEPYLKNPERINRAMSVDEWRRLTNELKSKKDLERDLAKNAFEDAKSSYKDTLDKKTLGYRQGIFDLEKQSDSLKKILEDAMRRKKSESLNTNLDASVSESANKSLSNLADRARFGSKRAMRELSKKEVEILPFLEKIQEKNAALSYRGVPDIGPESQEAYKNLGKLTSGIARQLGDRDNIPSKISARTFKEQLLEPIDEMTRQAYNKESGQRNTVSEATLKSLRRSGRDLLTQVSPEADRLFKDSAKNISLKDSALEAGFGNPRGIDRILKNLVNGGAEADQARSIISGIKDRTGIDLMAKLEPVIESKKFVKDPVRQMQYRDSLPESSSLKELEEQLSQKRSPLNRLSETKKSPEVLDKFFNLKGSKQAYNELSNDVSQLSGLENLRSNFLSTKPGSSRDLTRLSELENVNRILNKGVAPEDAVNFKQALEDRRILEQFQKPFRQGSANVVSATQGADAISDLLGAGIAGKAAAKLGGITVGRQLMDATGGRLGKFLLDSGINIRKLSGATLKQLSDAMESGDQKLLKALLAKELSN